MSPELDTKAIRSTLAEVGGDQSLQPRVESIIEWVRTELTWEPQRYQRPPDGEWWTWVFSGGAGCGKTDTGSWWMNEHMMGPPCSHTVPGGHKALIAGPTFADAVTTCWGPPAGISSHNREAQIITRKDGTRIIWPNGAEALVAGLHTQKDAEMLRARAANACCWWIDEAALATHLQLAMDLIQQRARLGDKPHGIVTSTPKPTPGWKYLISLPRVVQTRASSYDNKFLSKWHKEGLERFRGTRLERQEIYGELLDEYEGALWSSENIDPHRVTDFPADLDERINALGIVRIGVGVDPSTWIPDIGGPDVELNYEAGEGIETGLVVAGIDRRNPPHVYVLDDVSGKVAATEWARRATTQYHLWNAAWVVPETNAGGDMVLATIHLTDPSVTIYHEPNSKKPGVRAAVGKRARAEPVALLSDQGRLHMVGEFPALETTLKQWDPTLNWSPDRLDAMVWPITALRPWKRRGGGGAGVVQGTIRRTL